MRGLLLGNGINNRIGIDKLSVKDINRRFRTNIVKYSPVFESLFSVKVSDVVLEKIVGLSKDVGIELLAGSLYRYIKELSGNSWSDNDEYRIQDVVASISLLSIFYEESGKVKLDYNRSELLDMNNYDYVFTLNYYEAWIYSI